MATKDTGGQERASKQTQDAEADTSAVWGAPRTYAFGDESRVNAVTVKRVLSPTRTTFMPVATMKSGALPLVGCVGEPHATTTTEIMPTEADRTPCTPAVPCERKISDP